MSVEGQGLFYRGDFDDKVVEGPNGAMVNADYLSWLTDGLWGEVKVTEMPSGVWTVTGYSLNNYVFVEGETGLIAWDSGVNVGQGQAVLKMVQEHVDKPVSAVIYSHSHYVGGASAYAASNPDTEIEVYAHPDVMEALSGGQVGTFRDMQNRRAGMQLGAYLPHSGPDAPLGPPETSFDDPALRAFGLLPVTHPVEHGEEIAIDGVRFVFYHVIADTRDSIIAYVPDLGLALSNTVATDFLVSMYTLRGDYYRDPTEFIDGLDLLRSLDADYFIGVHHPPMERDQALDSLTNHRDAYTFTYDQSVRLLNQGKGPDDLVEAIRLPDHLRDLHYLFPAYVDQEHNVRGQYRGIVGWYGEEIADLHPPTVDEMGATIAELAGGTDAVVAAARRAIADKKYNLAAKLLTYVLAVDSDDATAKQLKADTLRQMAYTTRTGIQARNYLLSYALHLEGKIDAYGPAPFLMFGEYTADLVMSEPAGESIRVLRYKVDPAKAAHIDSRMKLTFTDSGDSYVLDVRRGVVETSTYESGSVDAELSLPRQAWAELVTGGTTVTESLAAADVTVDGDRTELEVVLSCFDNILT